jgi:GT2 family glycosyltransferase
MTVSVIVPVWQGQRVILGCLHALYANSSSQLSEVVCIDNASPDESAALIASHYPQVKLIEQPVNLGFAGGVNVGLAAASGDILVLLNQDCLVEAGWLPPLLDAFAAHPDYGILGSTIYNPDGSVNHTGAYIRRPDGYGVHETAVSSQNPDTPRPVEYVTGALFAIRRQVWQTVGPFDDAFYPAYYEEADYCYRGRQHGFQIGHLAATQATHHFSSREWQKEPLKHSANQHRARYHFVSKHFDLADLPAFFEAETAAIQAETYQDQLLGRALAARDLLRDLAPILAARRRDLRHSVEDTRQRLLQVHFTHLRQQSLAGAYQLPDFASRLAQCQQQLADLQTREHDLLARIYFRHPRDQQPESAWQRLWRLLVLRPLSFISLRDYLLLAQLNTLHTARADLLQQWQQINSEATTYQLNLLARLTEYEYR